MGLVRLRVPRTIYLFGHDCAPDGSLAGGVLVRSGARSIAGVAIDTDSEVRAVRFKLQDGEPHDVIEGHPFIAKTLVAGEEVTLSRLDYTDGELVLVIAETPADVPLLTTHVASNAVVRFLGNDAATHERVRQVHIQRPRCAHWWNLVHGGYVYHSATGGASRDRRWLVAGQLRESNPLDSIDPGAEFGDATVADTRLAFDTIATAADVVVTRVVEAGSLSMALRWAADLTVNVIVPEPE